MSESVIFQANNHSQWQISYKPVTTEVAHHLRSMCQHHFAHYGEIAEIWQVAEAEINSNNFKIVFTDGQVRLLRRLSGTRDRPALLRTVSALEYLHHRGIKVPKLLPASNGEFVVAADDYYLLFEFLAADHYRGALTELVSIAAEHGRLDRALADWSEASHFQADLMLPPSTLHLREFSVDIWNDIFRRAEAFFRDHPDDEFTPTLLGRREEINAAVAITPRGRDDLPRQLIHFDLHPHNVLTNGRDLVALIDFDSLRYLERMRGVAFAAHRLIRQYIVASNRSDYQAAVGEALTKYLGTYEQANPLVAVEKETLAYFIRHEALSRLSYAMKDLYYNQNQAWQQDLPKQLMNIAEAAYF